MASGRARTRDRPDTSRWLYQLSYRGVGERNELNCASLNHESCKTHTRVSRWPHPGIPDYGSVSRWVGIFAVQSVMRPVPCQGESAIIYAGLLSPGASACGEGPEPSELLRLVSKVKFSAAGIEARFAPIGAFRLSGFHVATRSETRLVGPLRPPSIKSNNASLKVGGLLWRGRELCRERQSAAKESRCYSPNPARRREWRQVMRKLASRVHTVYRRRSLRHALIADSILDDGVFRAIHRVARKGVLRAGRYSGCWM